MSAGKKIRMVALGVGSAVLLKTPVGRVLTTVAIARRVWADPKMQKIRRRVEKRVARGKR